MTTKMKKIYENIKFVLIVLFGTDCILAAKLSMITGQMVYWWLAVACAIGMIIGICHRPTDSEES